MTDNGGGTYSYSYTVTRPGIITVAILLYTQGGVFNEFFTSPDQSGNSVANGTWPNINLANAANNYFYSGQGSSLSANFYYMFKAPITGTIKFSVSIDDTVTMTIGN